MSRVRFLRAAALEYLEYDSTMFRWLAAVGGSAAGSLLWALPDKTLGLRILSRVHRSGGSDLTTAAIERGLRWANRRERDGHATGLWASYDTHITRTLDAYRTSGIVKNPKSLLGYRVLVLKSSREHEKGVIVVDYSYIFPLFAALFDVERIGQRYHIVLEPSWRGVCTADILAYSRYDFPVFIQSMEPRDAAFVKSLNANFVIVPTAAHWWVDHRIFTQAAEVERDIDVVMVAAWSDVKRHWRFFRVLADLRARGHRLKVALVGYPLDKTHADIEADARAFGVLDQIEIHQRLTLQQVGCLLARSKVHVLWSRKEAAGRATVEAMLADVPIIVREGLSYGYHYPYVNPSTGRFANDDNLAEALLEILSNRSRYHPRDWVMTHMSCQRATDILESRIRETAIRQGETWTTGLVVKTAQLEQQRYWDSADRARFEADYAYLEANIRTTAAR